MLALRFSALFLARISSEVTFLVFVCGALYFKLVLRFSVFASVESHFGVLVFVLHDLIFSWAEKTQPL